MKNLKRDLYHFVVEQTYDQLIEQVSRKINGQAHGKFYGVSRDPISQKRIIEIRNYIWVTMNDKFKR